MSCEVRCHKCSAWMGEADEPVQLRGMFETPRDREVLPGPRLTWRCKACSWTNVFRPVRSGANWRDVELKATG